MTDPSFKPPLITIGLTCYNAENSIVRAIESALEQTWENKEVIVVDDCSSDSSVLLINDLLDKHKNLRLIQHDYNKGYPAALNSLVEHAAGEFIAFFDDDDDARNDRLSVQYARLTGYIDEHNTDLVLCYSDRKVFVEGTEKPEAYVYAIGRKGNAPQGEAVANYLLWHEKEERYCWGEFGSCTLLVKTSVLKEYKFDEQFRRCAEWDLAIRVALDGARFIAVDEPLIIQHKTPTEDKAGKKPLQYGLLLREKHKAYLKRRRLYLSSKLQAYSRFYFFTGQRWKSRMCLAMACLFSPDKVLISEIHKRYS